MGSEFSLDSEDEISYVYSFVIVCFIWLSPSIGPTFADQFKNLFSPIGKKFDPNSDALKQRMKKVKLFMKRYMWCVLPSVAFMKGMQGMREKDKKKKGLGSLFILFSIVITGIWWIVMYIVGKLYFPYIELSIFTIVGTVTFIGIEAKLYAIIFFISMLSLIVLGCLFQFKFKRSGWWSPAFILPLLTTLKMCLIFPALLIMTPIYYCLLYAYYEICGALYPATKTWQKVIVYGTGIILFAILVYIYSSLFQSRGH